MSALSIDSYLSSDKVKDYKKNTKTGIKTSFNVLVRYYSERNIKDLNGITPESLKEFCQYARKNFKSFCVLVSQIKYLFIWYYENGLYRHDVRDVFSFKSRIILNDLFTMYRKALNDSDYSKETMKLRLTVLGVVQSFMNERKISDLSILKDDFAVSLLCYCKQKNYSPKYIKTIIKESNTLFNYLKEKKLVEKNPFERKRDFGIDDYPAEFKKYVGKYLMMKEHENTSIHSMRNIKNSLNVFFKYLSIHRISYFKEIKKDHLKDFIGYLIDFKKKDGSSMYITASINRNLVNIKTFFKYLSDKGMIYYGLISVLKSLKSIKNLHRNIMTRKELSSLFGIQADNLYEFMFKCLFVCQYSTGLRINELLNLKITDIDFTNKTLLIFESKTNKERYVHIGEVGLKYLDIYLKYAREKINAKACNMDKVFVSNYEGLGLREALANKYLKIFCKQAGIKKTISTHCFRHSYGTHLLENGAEIKHVSELLGHEKLSTTEGYTHLSPAVLKDVIKKYHPREV
jgi:integrase/recombinase XerD